MSYDVDKDREIVRRYPLLIWFLRHALESELLKFFPSRKEIIENSFQSFTRDQLIQISSDAKKLLNNKNLLRYLCSRSSYTKDSALSIRLIPEEEDLRLISKLLSYL
jgi:hypothetical protein